MRTGVGNGWTIVYLTDRVVELRKEDHTYRSMTGRDGYVRVRAEPGMDRTQLIEKAVEQANRTDEALTMRIAKRLMPSGKALETYRKQQQQLATTFATTDETNGKEYKP